MAPRRSKLEQARHVLKTGGVYRDDSDDELGTEDIPWEWIFEGDDQKKIGNKKTKSPKRPADEAFDESSIVGARMGKFECRLGDAVLLKAEGNEAWVGLINHFSVDEESGDMMANLMWFSSQSEIRGKGRPDAVENEVYITKAWDDNPLESINGKAIIMSPDAYAKRFPKGISRSDASYGKVFICRRGCVQRTNTFTDEFVWEDVYQGHEHLHDLEYIIDTQTKATRKRAKGKGRDLDDFVVGDGQDDEGIPQTPKKRRKVEGGAATPTSKRKEMTPRKLLTPSHKRIVVKKALEFTPLGTRILAPEVLSSPYQLARSHLHVSSVPASLPCREEEFSEVYSHLETAITAGTGSCIYIAGTPGTGKTATVREVVAQLNAAVQAEELDDFVFVEINGMKVTDPHQSYSLLWEALRGERVSPAHALELLEREFSRPSPRRTPVVVLMDELDQLVTKNQSVMYNFFNWPNLRHSRLIVLAVANTMDLPERTLSNKISSRLGLLRITFKGYTHAQLIQIIESRLANVPGAVVHPDAIQFASRKVAAVSGDARRCLDICRRAVEIAEAESLESTAPAEDEGPNTPSRTGRNKDKERKVPITSTSASPQKQAKQHIVTIATIKAAIAEATSSPLQQALRALPLSSKVLLAALLARTRRTGVSEALLGDVIDEARKLCLMAEAQPVKALLSTTTATVNEEDKENDSNNGLGLTPKRSTAARKGRDVAPRVRGMEAAVMGLAEAGVVGVESRRGERARRVRLGVNEEEVRLALRDDNEVSGMGFGG